MRPLNGAGVATIVVALLLAPPATFGRDAGPAPPPAPAPAAADDQPATDLRVGLSLLLGEHAFLVMETMRAASLGQGEEAALRLALDDNSAQLRAAVAGVYGDEAGERFGALWGRHVDLLLEYADAARRDDTAAAADAQTGLDAYVADFSAFLAGANPAFHAHDEAQALDLHVQQVRAFVEGEYGEAYESQREAFQHMFALGDHLGLGIARQFPERFHDGAVAFSPRSDLRLALSRLMAEHLILAAEAMRAGVSSAPDFDPGAAALDANTADLAAAVGSVYGPDAGSAFGEVWDAHVDAYVTFVQALGSGDDAAREASLASLHAYHDEIARFLAAANPNLDHEAVASLVRRHVQALISQAEATAAGDHERAVATTREAYAGMFEVAAVLADAIVRQFPDRFRDLDELPGTEAAALPAIGEHAAVPPKRPVGVVAMLLLVLLALVAPGAMRARTGPRDGSADRPG